MNERYHRRYLLVILLTTLAFNYVDRLALGLVMQDLKVDLHLSDTQLGLLTGFAFAAFYSAMGIPIARWADRGDRITILAVTTGLWCAMVALCGAARTFGQLLLIRVGVAVGEAGCIPPAHSLIADHFPRAERPRATSVFMLGGALSVVIGYFGAGWLNQLYGWRMMFVLLGLPGLVLAALTRLTLKDPRRSAVAAPAEPEPSLREVCSTLWRIPTFRHLLLAFSVLFLLAYGFSQWSAAFFVRIHGIKTGELGTWFTVIFGLSGAIGVLGGGEIASRFAANDERLQLRALVVLLGLMFIVRPFTYLVSSYQLALAIMVPSALIGAVGDGPLFAVIQTLVPARLRAMSIALIYLVANLVGMGLGPFAIGLLSDALRPWAGERSLRYALVAFCPVYLWAMWHLWRASETVTADLQAARIDRREDRGTALFQDRRRYTI
jgi:predicted MFS family arabinose efflux permease